MMKKIAIAAVVLVLLGYVGFVFFLPRLAAPRRVCETVEYLISDTTLTAAIHAKEVERLLRKNHLHPVGLPLDSVPRQAIETCLRAIPSVERAECYVSQADRVCIVIEGRKPILRVMSSNGERYYVDKWGEVMPEGNCVAYTPIATGHITRETATTILFPLAEYLQTDPFWMAQVTQIYVNAKQEITLVPRVGAQKLFLGKGQDFEKKLARIKEFYLKGVNRIGWNKYAKINVEFNNQIICTRK